MLKRLKAIAIGLVIATAAVAVVVFGTFIGTVFLFLGTVFLVAVFLQILWWTYREHQEGKKS